MKFNKAAAMRSTGFSLLELMITLAIIGILAAIALPAYKDYLIQGRIPDATSNLATKRVQMEQYFQDNKTYLNSDTGSGPCVADATTSKYFTFSCAVAASTYTITATGIGPMAGFQYTVDQSNGKTSTITASGWAHSSTSCWIYKKSGQC